VTRSQVTTRYLTPEQVLFLHSRLISETGGAQGVRDLGLLLSVLGRPRSSFKNANLYPDIFSKTGALMDSLVRNHPFVDDNKRTAIAVAGIFLRFNEWKLEVDNQEMVSFTLACAQSRLSFAEIADWFRDHSLELNPLQKGL